MPSYARFNCLLLLLLLPATGVGQVSPPTATGKSPAAHNYSQEAIVFEQASAKLVFESDGTFTREDNLKIRIQSDAGVQRYGVLTFSYAKSEQTLNIDFVRVHKPNGTVVLTPAENVQDMASDITRQAPFYSDLREKHIAVSGLGVGTCSNSRRNSKTPSRWPLENSGFRTFLTIMPYFSMKNLRSAFR